MKLNSQTGVVCKKEKNESSEEVCRLGIDEIVMVEQIDGLHCKISEPHTGWLPIHTQYGQDSLERMYQNEKIAVYIGWVDWNTNNLWLRPCMFYVDICYIFHIITYQTKTSETIRVWSNQRI